jgi:SAM-dependent methyltransferase
LLDRQFLQRDVRLIRRTRNLRLLPPASRRTGGKFSLAEWAHVIGIFQTLLHLHLENKESNQVLDVGCGTGLMGIAAEPFIGEGGSYTGLDVIESQIEFCRQHYPSPPFAFIHHEVLNPAYARRHEAGHLPWPLADRQFDLVTALSVWTHLNESDAAFYLNEVVRVLKPGGKVMLTCFLLDKLYKETVGLRSSAAGRFHMLPQDRWVFDQSAYGSNAWLHPAWAPSPEAAIGIEEEGLQRLTSGAGLGLVASYPGNWKEIPGVFFQDVLLYSKDAASS